MALGLSYNFVRYSNIHKQARDHTGEPRRVAHGASHQRIEPGRLPVRLMIHLTMDFLYVYIYIHIEEA